MVFIETVISCSMGQIWHRLSIDASANGRWAS